MGRMHIYYGDGKGKTTAATGLAIRFAGRGKNVIYLQFLKDGSSGEVEILKSINNIQYLCVEKNYGFTWNMNTVQFEEAKSAYTSLLEKGTAKLHDGDMLVLDEFLDVLAAGLVDRTTAYGILDSLKNHTETVITGHVTDEKLFCDADYITYMEKKKHPYDSGLPAREGIEY